MHVCRFPPSSPPRLKCACAHRHRPNLLPTPPHLWRLSPTVGHPRIWCLGRAQSRFRPTSQARMRRPRYSCPSPRRFAGCLWPTFVLGCRKCGRNGHGLGTLRLAKARMRRPNPPNTRKASGFVRRFLAHASVFSPSSGNTCRLLPWHRWPQSHIVGLEFGLCLPPCQLKRCRRCTYSTPPIGQFPRNCCHGR